MPLLLLAFIVTPLLELYVIIEVGGWIGALPTIGLLLADSLVGAVLVASQGRAAWRRLTAALAEGRVPHAEVVDGAMILLGGALLLTPGFVTDGCGLLLLLPPVRTLLRRTAARRVLGRAAAARTVFVWRSGSPGDHRYDVEGTGHEVPREDPDPRRLRGDGAA